MGNHIKFDFVRETALHIIHQEQENPARGNFELSVSWLNKLKGREYFAIEATCSNDYCKQLKVSSFQYLFTTYGFSLSTRPLVFMMCDIFSRRIRLSRSTTALRSASFYARRNNKLYCRVQTVYIVLVFQIWSNVLSHIAEDLPSPRVF